ncbi:MAG: hypothetical protein IH827_05380 [Myxococcales bacterium]|nr:hypothetical protein [Myxococcales bacterium]
MHSIDLEKAAAAAQAAADLARAEILPRFRSVAVETKDKQAADAFQKQLATEVTQAQEAEKTTTKPMRAVAFSPDGNTLATGNFSRTIRLWDTATGKDRGQLEGHERSVESLSFSRKGMRLASASNDATVKLGGQPFDNTGRWYRGSDRPFRLNRNVSRFHADPGAREEMELRYQTSGELIRPLVTLHTTDDPIVPFWHERLYRRKVFATGSGSLYRGIPVRRYGHCNFSVVETLVAFALLVHKVTGQELVNPERVLTDARSRAEFAELARLYGAAE